VTCAPEDSRAVPRAAVLLAVLALAGCGASAAAHHPTDAQIAHRAGLTLDDLPAGWRRVAGGRRADCPAFHAARHTASAVADSGRFARDAQRRQVAGAVFVYARATTARRVFAQLSSPATRNCYAAHLGAEARRLIGADRMRGVSAGVTRVDPLGDEQAGARFVIGYTFRGMRRAVYLDWLTVRSGRGIAIELYTGTLAPLDGGLRYNLTALTARRLAAELRR
jgi:hypothetical protein